MDLLRERSYLLWVILLGASFLISLAFYFGFPPKQTERVLFFPENITGDIKGEARLLPREHGIESQVRALVDEIMLGPERVRDLRVVPVDTVVRSVIVRNNNVYIDFSPQMVDVMSQMQESTKRAVQIIEHTIRYNFPHIHHITITIGGQLPGEPYFSIK